MKNSMKSISFVPKNVPGVGWGGVGRGGSCSSGWGMWVMKSTGLGGVVH